MSLILDIENGHRSHPLRQLIPAVAKTFHVQMLNDHIGRNNESHLL